MAVHEPTVYNLCGEVGYRNPLFILTLTTITAEFCELKQSFVITGDNEICIRYEGHVIFSYEVNKIF